MNRHRRILCLCAALSIGLFSVLTISSRARAQDDSALFPKGPAGKESPLPTDPDDQYWSSGLTPAGIWGTPWEDWRVYAIAFFNGDLYVAGSFDRAGDAVTSHIVRWDGSMWHAIANDMNGVVRSLAVYNNELAAGGGFTMVHGQMVGCIASFDGTNWKPMGAGMNGGVLALTVHDGLLYAGGRFSRAGQHATRNIAAWDGQSWSTLDNGVALRVWSLAVYDGNLLAAGERWPFGGTTVNHIGRWDGTSWNEVGAGVSAPVYTLATHDGELFVGGGLNATSGYVTRWNGTQWHPLLSVINAPVRSFATHDGRFVMGGDFTAIGGTVVERMAAWNGSAWEPFATGVSGGVSGDPTEMVVTDVVGVHSLVTHDGALFAGGIFAKAGDVVANRIARWDGVEWNTIGDGHGLADRGLAFVEYRNALIVGGFSRAAGLTDANRISSWNGESFSALGDGLMNAGSCNGCVPYVSALAVYDGDLIAGGNFHDAGGGDAHYVAKWDGTTWHAMGGGLGGVDELRARTNYPVASFLVNGSDLYVAGAFASAGGTPCNNVARWDGSAWHALGSGTNNDVTSLAMFEGELIAGGRFVEAGGQAAWRIARWTGGEWLPLGSGIGGPVFCLAIHDGGVVAGGAFRFAGGELVNSLAYWNGTSWQAMGDGVDRGVYGLGKFGADLIVGGSFERIDGISANYIARWDGTSWSPMGSGTDALVRTVVGSGGSLYVTGDFSMAGGKLSAFFARWQGAGPAEASLQVTPRVLDKRIQEGWVDARIELPNRYEARDVDMGSIVLNDVVAAEPQGSSASSGRVLWAKFSRRAVCESLADDGEVRVNGIVAGQSFFAVDQITTIHASIPSQTVLHQNQPNPFNPATVIRYEIATAGQVAIRVYDASGALVLTLEDRIREPGHFEVEWNGLDNRREKVASGVYFYRLTAPGFSQTHKMVMLK